MRIIEVTSTRPLRRPRVQQATASLDAEAPSPTATKDIDFKDVVNLVSQLFDDLIDEAAIAKASPSWDTIEISTATRRISVPRLTPGSETIGRNVEITATVQAVAS